MSYPEGSEGRWRDHPDPADRTIANNPGGVRHAAGVVDRVAFLEDVGLSADGEFVGAFQDEAELLAVVAPGLDLARLAGLHHTKDDLELALHVRHQQVVHRLGAGILEGFPA